MTEPETRSAREERLRRRPEEATLPYDINFLMNELYIARTAAKRVAAAVDEAARTLAALRGAGDIP